MPPFIWLSNRALSALTARCAWYSQGDISKNENVGWADIYFATHRPEQRWYYFPGMRNNELLFLLQCVLRFYPGACAVQSQLWCTLMIPLCSRRYDSRPDVPHRELTELERREGGRGFIPPLHSAVELPGTQTARKRLSLDFRMVCLLPLPHHDTNTARL